MENNFNTFLPIASIKQLSASHFILHIMLFTILKYSYKKGFEIIPGSLYNPKKTVPSW